MLVVAAGLAVCWCGGGFAEHGGTACYAVLVYLVVCFVATVWAWRLRPLAVAAIAVAVCWLVEAFQLTEVPARWAAHSTVSRLVLGYGFQWWDLAGYLVAAAACGGLHAMRRRSRATGSGAAPGRPATRGRGATDLAPVRPCVSSALCQPR